MSFRISSTLGQTPRYQINEGGSEYTNSGRILGIADTDSGGRLPGYYSGNGFNRDSLLEHRVLTPAIPCAIRAAKMGVFYRKTTLYVLT